jgi:hypothetical protein
MTDYQLPHTLIPGTKAQADEVQENLEYLLDLINTKLGTNNVQAGTGLTRSVFNGNVTLASASSGSSEGSSGASSIPVFCLNRGTTTNGAADLLEVSGSLTVKTKTGIEAYGTNIGGNTISIVPNQTITIVPTKLSNVATSANAISSGDLTTFTKGLAFDGDTTGTSSCWKSTYHYDENIGVAYIGQSGLTSVVRKIKLWTTAQSSPSSQSVSSVKVQISTDGTSWVDLGTYSGLATAYQATNEFILPKYDVSGVYSLRLLCNASGINHPAVGAWVVQEIQMLAEDPNGTIYMNETRNIFADEAGLLESIDNTIYRQPSAPTAFATNDIWLNTSVEPLTAKKFDGSELADYAGIPVGVAYLSGGAVTSVSTFAYNQNGYQQNKNSVLSRCWISPEYSITTGVPIVITHNLNVGPEAFCIPQLVCITPEKGANPAYVPGDIIQGPFCTCSGGTITVAAPTLSANQVHQPVGRDIAFSLLTLDGLGTIFDVTADYAYRIKIIY